MRPVVFVDVDGTVADSFRFWTDCYNLDHKTTHKLSDITEYDISKTFEDPDAFLDYYRNYRGVQPIEGALEGVRRLRELYRVVFVTQGFGAEWVSSWFQVEPKDYIYVHSRNLLRGFALIDDNPQNLDVFQGLRYLVRQPWNQNRGLNESTWEVIVNALERNIEYAREYPSR
jgi:5'(3')-deoxyribonucleotidase